MDSDGPGYWMYETSGALRPAIIGLIHGCALSAEDIAALRAYCRQWICAPVWDENPHATAASRARLAALRAGIGGLTSRAAIEAWLAAAVEEGMDPL
jgi:hypothetical protein